MGYRKYLILAALTVFAVCGVLAWRIQTQEKTIAALEASLKEKDDELKNARGSQAENRMVPPREPQTPVDGNGGKDGNVPSAPANPTGSYQVLKVLEADSPDDPRSGAQKLQELLADNPTEEEVAIACQFIFNKAADAQALPDYALHAIYASQSSPDLKRVIAQVLSQRGNDTLLHDQVAQAQGLLKSAKPKDRLDALNQLARMHSVHAVDAIAPSLQDSDSTVRLAALFALQDSGNQRHVSLVEPLVHDPDPSVSTLAGNVVIALRNLSSSARTSYSRADIQAELPPLANP